MILSATHHRSSSVALTATMHTFTLDIADVDRGVYEQVEHRVARHPSETVLFMVTRVLAYALEHREGIAFGRGVSTASEPAVYARDPTGRMLLWLDVGAPAADRLHRAAKQAEDVAVYAHRDVDKLVRQLAGATIHRAEEIRIHGVPEGLTRPLVEIVGRRNAWNIVRSGGVIYVTADGGSAEGVLDLRQLG